MSGDFLDTNILVYAFTNDPRQVEAARLVASGATISVQNLNEFVAVATRKLRLPLDQVIDAAGMIEDSCDEILPLTVALHHRGIDLIKRYKFHVYDSLIVAAALQSGCTTLWSEDMHHGLVIDGRLTIRNPFV